MSTDPTDTPSDGDGVRSALRRLTESDERAVIERADATTDDLDAAAEFVEVVGLTELERAIERADAPIRVARGKRALRAFRRFRRAAAGDLDADHFHLGRGTDLRRDGEPPSQ